MVAEFVRRKLCAYPQAHIARKEAMQSSPLLQILTYTSAAVLCLSPLANAQEKELTPQELLEELRKRSQELGVDGESGDASRRDPNVLPRKTIPAPATIFTNARYNQEVIGPFYVRHMLKAYQAHTKDTGKAKEAALLYIKECIRSEAALDRAIPRAERIKLGDAALKAGATDPLVRSQLGIDYASYETTEKAMIANSHLNKALAPLEQSAYGAYIRARHHLATIMVESELTARDNKGRFNAAVNRYASELGNALKKGDFIDNEVQILWEEVDTYSDVLGSKHLHQLHKTADSVQEPDPWLVCMLGASAHQSSAWDARGSGYANTVTKEGWDDSRNIWALPGR